MVDVTKGVFKLFGTHTSLGLPIAKDPLADFRSFLYHCWQHLNLPEPTPVQYDIAWTLMYGTRRQIIQAFRGVGKSWITSAFVVWLLYMNPQLNILVVSASKDRADDFTTFTMQLIKGMPVLEHLIPAADQRDSKVSFDVKPALASHAPSVKSLGITSQLAGNRADVIVPDDVEVPKNSLTQTMRDKLQEQVKEFDAILKPDGRIIYLGTPQTEMSLYNVVAKRGYKKTIWPARYPDAKRMATYGDQLAPMLRAELLKNPRLVGKPTDPRRFNELDLQEREASYGRSGFALQFMLDTFLTDLERFPLRVSDLCVMMLNWDLVHEKVIWASAPENRIDDLPNVAFANDHFYLPMQVQGDMVPYTGSLITIDPSGRGKDETTYCITKTLNSQIFLLEIGAFKGGYEKGTLEAISDAAAKHSCNACLIESNFGDGMFAELLKPYLTRATGGTTIEEVRHNIQKERRIIDTLEPVMNQHRLIVDRRVIEYDFNSTKDRPAEDSHKYQLIHQLTRMTAEKGALSQDDRVDVLSMAVAYWVGAMAKDVDKDMKSLREKVRLDHIKNLHKLATQGLALVVDSNVAAKDERRAGESMFPRRTRRSGFSARER